MQARFLNTRLLVLAAALGLAVRPASGAEADPFAFFEEEAVVLAAAKHPQKTSAAPANATVITAEEIARYGWRTLGEALQSVPGFLVTSDRNYSYLWVRGFGRPGDYNTRVLVLIDGHRINENVYGSVLAGHDFSLDLRAVSRIEVVKGPGSALYGDNALFAVVNIVTRAPSEAGARADVEGGSFGTAKVFLDAAHARPDGAGLYGAGSYRVMQGQDHRYPEFSAVNGGSAGRNADREENANVYLKLERPGWALRGGHSARDKRVPTASYGTRFNDHGNYTSDSRSFVELSGERRLSDEVAVTGRAYYDWYLYQGDYIYDNSAPPPDRLVNKDLGRGSWFGQELRARFTPFGEKNALMVGQEFEKNLEALQRNYDQDPLAVYMDDTRREHRWALFAQQELSLGPDLALTAGLRFDRYQSFGPAWNPRAALVYRPWETTSVKLLYGSAFRAPTPYERFYQGTGSIANPGLMAEKLTTYEAVVEQRLAGRGTLSASYFQNHTKHLITQITDPAGLLQFVNKEKIHTDGMELAARWELTRGLSGRLGYTLQSTREMGGDRLSDSPTHTGAAGLSLRLPRESTVSAESLFIGARRSVRDTALPATAVFNLILRARPWSAGPTFHAAVYNALDAGYAASGAGEHVQSELRQDGRNFLLGLEHRFGGR